MVQRSSIIFAVSLAVLSTLEPTLSFAAAAPAHHRDEAERPRFLKREVKRYLPVSNTTSSSGPNPPFGESSSDLERLTHTLTTPPPSVTPEVVPETTAAPATTFTTDQGVTHDEQWSRSELTQSFQQQSQAPLTSATTPATSLAPSSNSEQPATKPTTGDGIIESSTLPATSPPIKSSTEVVTSSATIATANTETNPSPATSLPATSNTLGVATSATSPTANTQTNAPPTISPTVNTRIETIASGTTTPVGISGTSSPVVKSVTESSNTAGSTPSTSAQSFAGQSSATQPPEHSETGSLAGGSSSQPTVTPVTGPTITSGEQTTAGVVTARTASSESQTNTGTASETQLVGKQTAPSVTPPSIPPTGQPGFTQPTANPVAGPIITSGEQTTTGVVTASTTSSESQTNAGTASETQLAGEHTAPSVTPPSIPPTGQPGFTQPTVTPVAGPTMTSGEQTMTGVVTARSASSESQTNVGTASETQSAGGQIVPSVTPLSVPPKTQPGFPKQSQTTQFSAPELSNTPPVSVAEKSSLSAGQQSASGQQTQASSNALGIATLSVTPEQTVSAASASITSLTNPNQQPITQSGQTQTNIEGTTASHSTALSEVTGRTSAANRVAPSNVASVLPLSGETIQSSPGNAVPSTNPDTGVSANTRTSQNGLIPTLSASIVASIGASPVASLINGAQSASSPTLPYSAILLTATKNKPLITPSTGENDVPASTVQQGTSKAGVFFSASESHSANSVNSESAEGSTPTGSALYSALTDALQKTVGPGSIMRPNGVVVPTASSAMGAVSQSEQQTGASRKQGGVTEQTGTQAQSGAIPIVQVTSNSLPGGSFVPNPSVSAVISAASVTLPGGIVVPKPSVSETVPATSATLPGGIVAPKPMTSAVGPVASISLPGGSVIPNPSASLVASVASVTLLGGSVIPNPSASGVAPTASVTLQGGSVIPNPSASPVVPAASVTLPGGSVVPNPSGSPVVSVASVTLPGGSVVPKPLALSTAAPQGEASAVTPAASVTLPVGGVTQSPAAPVSDTALPPIIPASVTLPGGSVIQNPTATLLPSDIPALSDGSRLIVTPLAVPLNTPTSDIPAGSNLPLSGLHGSSETAAAISNTLQSSGALPQALATDSNGVVLPVQKTGPIDTSVIKTGLASGGNVASETAVAPVSNTVPTGTLPIIVGSASDSSGKVRPITAGQTTGSVTAPGGSVIPLVASTPTVGSGSSPIIVGSATNSNGVAFPITAGQVTGSSTLSGSSVVPLIASTPTAGSGSSPITVGSATNSNGVALPIIAGQVTGSSTLSDGSVVPLLASAPRAGPTSDSPVPSGAGSRSDAVSGGAVIPITSGKVSPTAATGQAVGAAGETAAGQTAGAIDHSGSGVVAPQTGVPAPAPLTGTATAAPNIAGTLPAQGKDQHYQTNAKGPFTQLPTGSDTATAQTVPTSILAGPSSMPPSQTSNYGSTGLPTGWPLFLYPPDGRGKRPDNTESIQIGFLYPLNYEFVWTHEDSQKQIFKYLPMGIAWGLQIDVENVTMQALRAKDTTQDLFYVTTFALAFVPSGQVEALGRLVHNPTSRFYLNPDNSINTLLSMINTSFPIATDNGTGGGSTVLGASPSSTATMKDGGAPVGGGIGSSNPIRVSSVGIGVGVAFGAAAYGAAMFFVARRYKKRRQSHLRSPSMFSSPVMSHVGPDAGAGAALMSGGMGGHRSPSPYHDNDGRADSRGSGRSGSTGRQQISAPVMAENSLGWN